MKLKKRMTLWLLCWCVFAQGATPNKEKSSTTEKDIFIDNLLDKMTLDEKSDNFTNAVDKETLQDLILYIYLLMIIYGKGK